MKGSWRRILTRIKPMAAYTVNPSMTVFVAVKRA
jgi:hypothetical protein